VSLFQVDPVSKDNRTIEGKSRFRAIPIDELIDGVIVRSLAAFRCEAIDYRRLGVRDQEVQEIA
jgi:hypothetical protein